MKNWKGNSRSTHATLGSSNHVEHDREENDYYATDPIAIDLLTDVEPKWQTILEPSCGEGHLSKRLVKLGYDVLSSDLVDRGFGLTQDFFEMKKWKGDIITNPPYKFAQEFVEHAMDITKSGAKIAMFLKIQFLEGQKRRAFFKKYPPKTVYVSSSRMVCALGGDFVKYNKPGAIAYAWYVWQNGFQGHPKIKWIN